jgi:tRNA nucleotidyltransferase (CCA-adding enzyme)
MGPDRNNASPDALFDRVEALPETGPLRTALEGEKGYLVGGAVRDLLLGAEHPDLDVAVDGDAGVVARRLGADAVTHERFGTARVDLGGSRIDLARTRSETYPHPGALPEVRPASIEQDLARRDFAVNAMAVPLAGPMKLIDPHGGLDDLRAGRLSVLHPDSFTDDPTRALRAARYAARLGFELESATAELLAAADLGTVSRERVEAELHRIADEEEAATAFALLARWGLAEVDSGAGARVGALGEILDAPEWAEFVDRGTALYCIAVPNPELEMAAVRISSARPKTPSEIVRLVHGRSPLELAAARLAGADWIDDYVRNLRHVRLEIDGDDLIAAGVPEGPAVGRGLAAALAARLDGQTSGRDDELRIALTAARAS